MYKTTVRAFLIVFVTGSAVPLGIVRLGIAAPPNVDRHAKQVSPPPSSDDCSTSCRGVIASISIDKAEYKTGESMKVTVTITCKEEGQSMFNVTFNSLLKPPGKLFIRDSRGDVVNTLLDPADSAGSRRSPSEEDWIAVPHGVFIGTTLTVEPTRLASIRNVERLHSANLREGEYTIQLVLDNLLQRLRGGDETGDNAAITTTRIPFRIVGRQ